MPVKKGAFIQRKGKFFMVQLVMSHQESGGKEYLTVYGQYINDKEARKICQKQNRFVSCVDCPWVKTRQCQL